jgi:hypothetical protein
MGLLAHERKLLVKLYFKWRIPIDQFEKRPEEKQAFVDEWNKLSGRHDDPGEVIHYMKTQRKRGLWVTFDGAHEATPPTVNLSAEHTEVLTDIFYDQCTLLENGSDVLAFDDELADLIAKEFAANTGRIVPAHQLVAKLTALRKRGLLHKVSELPKNPEPGFEDIDEVEGPKLNDKSEAK